MQLVASAASVVILIGVAILLGRIRVTTLAATREAPTVRLTGGIAFLLGSAFMSLLLVGPAIPASLNVAGLVVLIVGGGLLFWSWSRRPGWSEYHRFAVAGGLVVTYVWYSFVQVLSVGDSTPLSDAIGNAVFATGAFLLLVMGRRQAVKSSPSDV
jgi:hypothetical protein